MAVAIGVVAMAEAVGGVVVTAVAVGVVAMAEAVGEVVAMAIAAGNVAIVAVERSFLLKELL
jgi:hypothetical protein